MKPVDIKQYKGQFFKILGQTELSQFGVMNIKPGHDSGPKEKHPSDQIIYVIEGEADIEIENDKLHLTDGMLITVPEQSRHHIYNNGTRDFFFLTIYAPPVY